MSIKDAIAALVESEEAKSAAKEFFGDAASALFGDPVSAAKAITALFKSPIMLQNYIFWTKFRMYLEDIYTDDETSQKLSAVFAENEEQIEFAERIISAVDKIETKSKVLYISNLTRALLQKFICKDDYYRFIWCIVNIPHEDLIYLSENIECKDIFDNIHLRFLEKFSLVTRENVPMFTKQQIEQEQDCYKYNFIDFAKALDKFSLSYGTEKYKYSDIQPPLSSQMIRVSPGTSVLTTQGGVR